MDHHQMLLLSILFQLLRCLLGLTAVLMRGDLSKEAELLVLRHENAVLRRGVTRVRYTRLVRTLNFRFKPWLRWLAEPLLRRRLAEDVRDEVQLAKQYLQQTKRA